MVSSTEKCEAVTEIQKVTEGRIRSLGTQMASIPPTLLKEIEHNY